MSSEPGRSDWSQRLGALFGFTRRHAVSVAQDILPVVLVEDITVPPHQGYVPFAATFDVGAVAGAFGLLSCGFDVNQQYPEGSFILVDRFSVRGAGSSLTFKAWIDEGHVFGGYTGSEFQAPSLNPGANEFERTGAIIWPVTGSVTPEPARYLWEEADVTGSDYRQCDHTWVLRPGHALWIRGLTVNTRFLGWIRGRIYIGG